VLQSNQGFQTPPVLQSNQGFQTPPVGVQYAFGTQVPPYPASFQNGQPQYHAGQPQPFPAGSPGFYPAPYQQQQPPHPSQMPNGFSGNPAGTYQNNPVGMYQNNPAGTYQNNPVGTYQNNPAGTYQNNPTGTYQNNPAGTYQNNPAGTYQNNPTGTYQNNPAGAFYNFPPAGPYSGNQANALPSGRAAMPAAPAGGTNLKTDQYEDLKTASFYNESYKKPGKGRMKGLLVPIVIVGLLCSILGGAVTGAGILFFAPVSRPAAAAQATNPGETTVRKIEIVDKTSSPVTAIAEKAGPSVVGINVEFTYSDSFFGTQDGGGQGSGIIISSDGYILTNNHVVEAISGSGTGSTANKGKITVILPNQKDKPYVATVVGTDAKTDIAVIKIEAVNLTPAEIGDSDILKVGEMAVAIGNPAGLEYMGSVTAGIISGLNREVDTGDGKMLRLIQTDAAISPGNSGGALLNSKGQVIGVNSSKIGGSSYEGLGFAIPIKDAMAIANTLMKDGFVTRPLIGVSVDNSYTADVAKTNKTPEGALVGEVVARSSAEKGGVKAGDIITQFNGVRVTNFDELEAQKNLHMPGDKVTLEVFRIPAGGTADKGVYLTLNLDLGSTAAAQQ
jgi:serine protease Do